MTAFITLAFGFCAYTVGNWAFIGNVVVEDDGGKVCEMLMGTDSAWIGGWVDGHDVAIRSFGAGRGMAHVDGKRTLILPAL